MEQIKLVIAADFQSVQLSPWNHRAWIHFVYFIIGQVERCEIR